MPLDLPQSPSPHVFSASPLDRESNRRRDPQWVAGCLRDPAARFLPFRNLEMLIERHSAPQIAWRGAELSHMLPLESSAVLLGLRDGVPYFAIDVGELDDPRITANGAAFSDVRGVAPDLPVGDSAIAAQARSLVDWHARHQYCARCGAHTTVGLGGAVRRCDSCSAEHFPRIDPVVIMLAIDGDHCLLGRGRGRPGSMYTSLAGFMEPGETIEEAVRREVSEEAGIRVDEVYYHSSQPWPFPASLMIGCHATVSTRQIEVDPEELADARWFPREQVAAAVEAAANNTSPAPELDFSVPAPFTISHQLIRAWVG